MARLNEWSMIPGETLDLGISLEDGLDSAEVLTGTPGVSVYTKSGSTYTALSAGVDYTVTDQQVNAAEFTDANGDAVAIGKGVLFRLTAPTVADTYYVLVECDGGDGSRPHTYRTLTVDGPGPA